MQWAGWDCCGVGVLPLSLAMHKETSAQARPLGRRRVLSPSGTYNALEERLEAQSGEALGPCPLRAALHWTLCVAGLGGPCSCAGRWLPPRRDAGQEGSSSKSLNPQLAAGSSGEQGPGPGSREDGRAAHGFGQSGAREAHSWRM